MTMDQSSTEKLREEILADAGREAEKIVIRAKQDAEALLTNAAAEADRLRQERLNEANAEAARQSELILATVPVEIDRLRAARVEALLATIYEEASERLLGREGFEYRETVIALAAHAIRQMEGDTFVVKLSGADQAILGDALVEEISGRVGRPVSITISNAPDISEGGVIVEDGEARQVWDNRLLKRLERLWPELRRQIAAYANFVPKTGSGGNNP
jgi:V/A-type H+-transporting ATPase subunit E